MRTCHYIILGVEKSASDVDIKKAYRRKALEWHPDKNHHRVEEATQQFALIADAYEVLSDPQERAWYDSHRDAILRGDDKLDQTEGAAGTTSSDLMRYFSSSVYKEFKDDNTGFFAIYRNIFEKLAQEEAEAVAITKDQYEESSGGGGGGGGGVKLHYPSFGCSTTAYDSNSDSDVKQFYNAWLTFSSQKSFSWCDKFRLSEALDRRMRRAMEKENKKLRDVARKEFNETVLFLASFVRKRDPRVLAYQDQQKQKQEQARADLKARLEKEREILRAKVEAFQEQEWTRVQEENIDHENEGSESDNQQIEEEYECIICDKSFKSEQQLKNHEQNKKHLKAVEEIRLEMLYEENQLMGGSPNGDVSISPKDSAEDQDQNGEDEEEEEEEEEEEREEELEMPSRKSKSVDDEEDPLSGSDAEVVTPTFPNLKSKKKNKKKKVLTTGLDIDEAEIDKLDQDGLADLLGSVRVSSLTSPLGRSRASTPNNRRSKAQKDPREGDSDYEQEATPQSTAPASRAESPDGTGGSGKGKKMSVKKKKVRSERAAQKLLTCRTCSVDFDSKNCLFVHIKETGHDIAIETAAGSKLVLSSSVQDGFFSSDEESTRGKGKKGRGKRK
ncbi:hypothetical protein BGZ65_002384 [Modicella reniformis]|uniref:J domain-containing protein n=1 Tax=Modicella reniformis TaxID=1440133 RepID=A0A9P6MJ19_9FUNG|nr:hypothetical protein BGZ65_002384 [Modicella reniformis]